MIKTKRILDLQKNDRIEGKNDIFQVISNNNGLLYLYSEKTGFFTEKNLKRYLKQDINTKVYIL